MIASASGIAIHCQFYIQSWNMLFDLYTCRVVSINFENPSIIERVGGTHMTGKENEDVFGFTIAIQQSGNNLFPKNLDKFFPNLLAIEWVNYDLSEINAEDLRPWRALGSLSFAFNSLTTLDGDLFKYNRDLQIIRFDRNKISHVGSGLLSGLYDLKTFLFRDNPCLNFEARTPQAVQQVIQIMIDNCSPANNTTNVPILTPSTPPPKPKTTVTCEYYNENWPGFFEIYTCKVIEITLGTSENIEEIRGAHLESKGHADVLAYTTGSTTVGSSLTPKNLFRFFPNLMALAWNNYNLTKLTADDLKPWPLLAVLNLAFNSLTTLDGNLFENNLELRSVDLSNNQISSVGTDLLAGLNHLETFLIGNNPCISFSATNPRMIEELKQRLRNACPPLRSQ